LDRPETSRSQATELLFEIEVDPPPKGSRQSAKAVYVQLKAAIHDGRLAAGAKLPPTRGAGAFFGVSRNTAGRVYEKLEHEGLVVTRHGSGSYVAPKLPSPSISPARAQAQALGQHRINAFWRRLDVAASMNFWRDSAAPPAHQRKIPQIDLRPVIVDSTLFPFDLFRRVSAAQLRGLAKKPASHRGLEGNQGNYSLRQAVSRHLAVTRAVVCQADDIIVTAGAQQAFDLLARVLVTPNETVVAFEDPGYPPMRVNFAAAGAKLVPVGVDGEGLIVEQLPKDVGVIYVTPSHQFPLGITMSPRRRKALIEYARKRGAVIIEDDYDGEFRHEGAPVEALRSAEAADVVFYVGTFSKSMLPALRLGFVVAPDWLTRTLTTAKNCMDWHCSTPVQRAVARFIADGHLSRHVLRMRAIYKQRRNLILELLDAELGSLLEPIPSLYGMHVAVTARTSVNLETAVEDLLRQNVRIHTFSRYFFGPQTRRGLILGFGSADPSQIRGGFSSLRKALQC
jgi:GntR family transcriptional regulator / MocR family aminotransferase